MYDYYNSPKDEGSEKNESTPRPALNDRQAYYYARLVYPELTEKEREKDTDTHAHTAAKQSAQV